MKLHLGVIDLPYSYHKKRQDRANKKRAKKGLPPSNAKLPSTGDVAEWLENKYHVMELFHEENREFIQGALEQSLQGQLEDILMGAPIQTQSPFAEGTSEIEARFKKFLSNREVEHLGVPGVPTQAAKDGISHRFKKKKKKGPRPSFIDTGLYQSAFKAWVE